jgi:outer membrane protein assembly factor BamB
MAVKMLVLMLLLLARLAAADGLILCGGSEVFIVEPGATAKVWSWKAKDRSELPAGLGKTFATTDDCKPVDNGKRILVSSSSGGCALVERETGKTLWWAKVRNAHSIEALPAGRIIVASSVGGDKLVLFDTTQGDRVLWETPLPSAHGVVWDAARQRLFALGFKELRSYSLRDWETAKPALDLKETHPLPDEDGHDLSQAPGSSDLVLTTNNNVWLFDRDKPAFRPHPEFKDRPGVKCVSIHPLTGRTLLIQSGGGHWWSDTAEFSQPNGKITMKGETLYKGRWLVEK